jgi:phytoene dehydrogenase-like protein
VQAVVTEAGERIGTRAVITAMDPKTALLQLLDPPLAGQDRADLTAARRGNVVQALVHVATDRLPPYPNTRPGDWNGLQSFVDRLDHLVTGWAASEARALPDPLPLYAFTTSAIDDTLAPAHHHTVYLACPAAPSRIQGGWPARRDEFVERCLETVEDRAPGFRSSIVGTATHLPDEMERGGRWPGAHPMYLDLALDQLGPFRPTRRLGHHRTPVQGLYLSGAGTGPTGGIAGTPGRAAAQALLADTPSPSNR